MLKMAVVFILYGLNNCLVSIVCVGPSVDLGLIWDGITYLFRMLRTYKV